MFKIFAMDLTIMEIFLMKMVVYNVADTGLNTWKATSFQPYQTLVKLLLVTALDEGSETKK